MSFKGKREGNKGKAKIGNGKITKGGNKGNKGKGKKIQTKGIKKNNTQTSSSVNINVDNVAKSHAKTPKGRRILDSREPKVIESVKRACFVKGISTSNIVNDALHDLYAIKRPDATFLSKRNSFHPFETGKSEANMEFLARKNDSSFMIFGSHSKKRPNCLTFVRYFDDHILDMMEFLILDFTGIKTIQGENCHIGSKPCFLFNGDAFEQRPDCKLFKEMILDLYHGTEVQEIDLEGLEYVLSLTAVTAENDENAIIIYFRVYKINLKIPDNQKETKCNIIELSPMGPFMNLKCGRVKYSSDKVMKNAIKIPNEQRKRKIKNVKTNSVKDVVGRIHMSHLDFNSLQTRKMKGLKKDKITKNATKE